jgi:hypothetical protein
MKLDDVIKRMPIWYKSGKSFYLKSPPGRGKTTTLVGASTQLGKAFNQNIGHVIINGPLLSPQDAVGYLIPKHHDTYSESLYTDPFWFKTKDGRRLSDFDGGIIIVDEADKMDVDVKKIIGEAALSKRLGPHQLSDGWRVWMAGNRSQDRSGSTKELDHLINRRCEQDITDDLQSLLNWMARNNISPITQTFADRNPHIVLPEKLPEKQGPYCTPRSLCEWDDFLKVASNGDTIDDSDPLLREEAAGFMGDAAVSQYFALIKLDRSMPRFEKIIKDPEGVVVPEKPDAQMLAIFNLAARVDPDTIDPVIKYVQRMGQEFAITFAKSAINRFSELVVHPSKRKWCLNNASLMAALA